jgi:fermentation-respiration switch protein FrsA (DUF1100 family)
VIEIAAGDGRVAAVIAQVPYVEGIATLRKAGAANMARLTLAGLRDQAGRLLGRDPYLIPLVGPPGTLAAMNTPDAAPGYAAMYDPGFEWRNEFTARVALRVGLYRPGKRAKGLTCPILVAVATDDAITPPEPALAAGAAAARGELAVYAGLGHFDPYRGEPFETAMADQVDFLRRHLFA